MAHPEILPVTIQLARLSLSRRFFGACPLIPCPQAPDPVGREISTRTIGAVSAGQGFDKKGQKSLAYPDFSLIKAWWHPSQLPGLQPRLKITLTAGSRKSVGLRCLGCKHGYGRWASRRFAPPPHTESLAFVKIQSPRCLNTEDCTCCQFQSNFCLLVITDAALHKKRKGGGC